MPTVFRICWWPPSGGRCKLFHNRHGKLAEQTEAAGLAERTGWWNGIAAGDFDGDGRIDYLVTNVGLNTKYGTATSANPATAVRRRHGRRAAATRSSRPNSARKAAARPRRSAITTAMPQLARKFPTYRAYAAATLTDMFWRR